MTTFFLVMSTDGLEGSFVSEADAMAYVSELHQIGVVGLRIVKKVV